jgi:hypothetical protein
LQLFLTYHYLYCGRLPLDSHYPTFFPIHLHYMSPSNNLPIFMYWATTIHLFIFL